VTLHYVRFNKIWLYRYTVRLVGPTWIAWNDATKVQYKSCIVVCYVNWSLQEVYEDAEGDCSYGTRLWDTAGDSATLAAVHNVVEVYCKPRRQTNKRPWERVMDDVAQRLNHVCGSDSKFHRPPAKTDRLFAVLERGTDPVLVKHPVPLPGSEHLYRENLPNIRCGTIASGRVVAGNALWRTEVKL